MVHTPIQSELQINRSSDTMCQVKDEHQALPTDESFRQASHWVQDMAYRRAIEDYKSDMSNFGIIAIL